MERKYFLYLCLSICCVSCVPYQQKEMQHTVAQADSMRTEGRMYSDSVQLAQAYRTLGKWQWLYADDYAGACYHYGRLLRDKDDPVSAMQCFINATHSRTHDYHILGRIYSNMGSICHMASAFSLAANMYERSAQMFLHAGDSTAYHYGLYRIAYEKSATAEFDECINYVNMLQLPRQQDRMLDAYCYITLAEMHLHCLHYDSTVYYAHQALVLEHTLLLPVIQLAQAYSLLSIKDSAVYYAQQILSRTDDLFAVNNALYILTNDDETKDKSAIRQTAADRSDTQKLLEIRQGKLSQAVQLLEFDINRKPNLWWLYSIIATLTIVGVGIFIYVHVIQKRHALLSRKMQQMKKDLSDLRTNRLNQIDHVCSTLRVSDSIQNDLCWKDFDKMCNRVNDYFFMFATKLKKTTIFNETEIRVCVLVLIGLNRTEIANTLPYAPNSVGKLKDHTAKKLGTTGKNLRQFLLKMAIEN